MRQLLANSGLATKIRAMQKKLLTENDFRTLAEITSVPLAVAFLRQKSEYSKVLENLDDHNIHRGDIEKLLMNSVYTSFARIYRFSTRKQRFFLDLYFKYYEVIILKNCLSNILDNRRIDLDISLFKDFFDNHSKLDIETLAESSSTGEFIDNLKGTPYYKPLSQMTNIEHPTPFDYEIALDLYYFGLLWKAKDQLLSKSDLLIVIKTYGTQCDLLNLQWIYRAKKFYNMSRPDVYALTIPILYRLKKRDIIALVETEDDEAFHAALDKTYYGLQYLDLSPETLEAMYGFIMRKVLLREAKQNPYSVSVLYRYLHAKDYEIQRIIVALECIRYGVDPQVTLEHILKF